jgi:hypothetical protein
MVHRHRTQLVAVGGSLRGHCTLSLGRWSSVSVAQRSGRGGLGFRPGETETGFAWAGTRGQRAGRWCPGVDGIVPCRLGCRARLGSGLVHGNGSALWALWVARWHDTDKVGARSTAKLVQI